LNRIFSNKKGKQLQ